ncbi:SIR2 family protein [Lutibacter sp. B1]|uniref:SIR2 family protein n=1 Tax=Lutibacter sp. B1 TaxID=2725996 RepID=UPI0014575B56|nr:SIR2 family protein [Lutibacter sp. B1]NLP58349.1 SIR2 family protein [Lutibacter sp. B1]
MIHDPIKHLNFLRQTLSQDKRPLGFFISAGCPLAVKLPDDQWPLIPDVAGLTKFVAEELGSKDGEDKNSFDKLIEELVLSEKNPENIEDVLSFIRSMKVVATGNEVRGFNLESLEKIEKDICEKIVSKLNVDLPTEDTPYHKLAQWISLDRSVPIEVFTTNYDLLAEQAFEELAIPYFDGFVGSRQSFFDLRAVEDDLIPNHWTRLWKIHGSINWFQKKNKDVYRTTRTDEINGSHLIYPSHLKYDQSRKMPYLALIDKLSKFLKQSNSIMIMTGYSFNDDHLNDTILNALKANPNTMVIAMLFGNLTTQEPDGNKKENYPNAIKLAKSRSNLSIWGKDEAIIGTVRAKWDVLNEFIEEYNLANSITIETEAVDGANDIKTYKMNLGDYSKLGDFLQALIGYNQTNFDEN